MHTSTRCLLALCLWTIPLFLSTVANASLVVTFTETAQGVTISGSGSLATLDGLTFYASTDIVAADQYFRNSIAAQIRSTTDTIDAYYADFGFTSFASLGATRALGADPGIEFGVTQVSTSSRVYLPSGYAAGQEISFSITNPGDTLADFGLTVGDTWGATWQTGNANTPTESIIFQAVSSSSVPEPSTLLLFIGFGLGIPANRRRAWRGKRSL